MSDETEPLDAQERDLGIPNDTPDEIMDFVKKNDVADKYTVMLKRKPEGGGTPGSLRNFTNWYPNVNTIGEEYGPGEYELVFAWRGEGVDGKKGTITRSFKINLPAEAWDEIHEDWMYKRHQERLKKKEKGWSEEAAKIRAQGGVVGNAQAAPQVSELDVLKKYLDVGKSLGINIGGKNSEKSEPKKSFADTLVAVAPAITALGAVLSPIAVALITRPREKKDDTLTNTLLTHVLNKPQEDNPMKQVLPFLLGSLKEIVGFKQSLEPEEKESMVERIIGKLAPMAGMAFQLAMQPKEQRDKNPLVNMARNDKDVQAVQADPEALLIMVQRLDEVYGFQQANQILEVAGVGRPAELVGNFAQWPSKGFRADGTVDDGRTPPPDTAGEEPPAGQDDLVE